MSISTIYRILSFVLSRAVFALSDLARALDQRHLQHCSSTVFAPPSMERLVFAIQYLQNVKLGWKGDLHSSIFPKRKSEYELELNKRTPLIHIGTTLDKIQGKEVGRG
jgi:hypothetical protein